MLLMNETPHQIPLSVGDRQEDTNMVVSLLRTLVIFTIRGPAIAGLPALGTTS
jgi:hypothetical protein